MHPLSGGDVSRQFMVANGTWCSYTLKYVHSGMNASLPENGFPPSTLLQPFKKNLDVLRFE